MLHFKTWLTQFLMTLLIMTANLPFTAYSLPPPPPPPHTHNVSLGLLVASDMAQPPPHYGMHTAS